MMERHGGTIMNNGRILSMHRRGSNGNALNVTAGISGKNGINNSFRDKLSKFKDGSFRQSSRISKGSKLDSFSDHMSTSLHRSSHAKKRSVRFARSTENVVHEIESYDDLPKSQIWWSMEELSASRAEGQILFLTDSSVQKYLTLYDEAKRQVKTDRKLSSDSLKELVKYVAEGYLGLEDQYNINARIEEIQGHVISVVRYYRQQSPDNSSQSFHDSFSSSTSSNTMTGNPCNTGIWDQNVRTFASKSSAGNRHLAIAMGNALFIDTQRESRRTPPSVNAKCSARKNLRQ